MYEGVGGFDRLVVGRPAAGQRATKKKDCCSAFCCSGPFVCRDVRFTNNTCMCLIDHNYCLHHCCLASFSERPHRAGWTIKKKINTVYKTSEKTQTNQSINQSSKRTNQEHCCFEFCPFVIVHRTGRAGLDQFGCTRE